MNLKLPVFFGILGVLCTLFTGCVSPLEPSPPGTVTPTATQPAITTLPTPLPTTTAPPTVFTRDQVGHLFIDIAFGCDNTGINKIAVSHENHLFISLEGLTTPEDRSIVEQFARQYNLMTATETFTDDPLSDKGARIIFFPGKSLDTLEKTFVGCREIDPATGTDLLLIYKPIVEYPSGEKEITTRIYINADLEGARRQYYLQRALLYYIGFPGKTYSYPESFFYYNTSENVAFTTLDIEAMKTMQNPGIYNGMPISEARWILLDI